jgi:hypothetical protein
MSVEVLSQSEHRFCERAIVGDGAMTVSDYVAIGALIILILWAAARFYLESRRF